MRTLEITLTVQPDGTATLELPPDVLPGEHRAVLVIEETSPSTTIQTLDDFPVHDLGPWPDGFSLRREDLYDDWGR